MTNITPNPQPKTIGYFIDDAMSSYEFLKNLNEIIAGYGVDPDTHRTDIDSALFAIHRGMNALSYLASMALEAVGEELRRKEELENFMELSKGVLAAKENAEVAS